MKIAFFGTPYFAAAQLEHLIQEGFQISVVVTAPDKPAGRGRKINQSAVKEVALKNGLNLLQPTNLKEVDFVDQYQNLEIDVAVVVAFRMLPESIWKAAKLGTFNLHASILPSYRGAAPIQWAIINNESQSGVTTFLIDDQIDTGNILLQAKCDIDKEDTGGSLHDKLLALGKPLIVETIRGLIDGKIKPTNQDESSAVVSYAPKLNKENTHLHLELKALDAELLVRALNPFPGAYGHIQIDQKLVGAKIWKAKVADLKHDDYLGVICVINRSLFIRFKDSWLEVVEWQLEGKKRMLIRDFLNGNPTINGAKWQ
jgi:methionyl-tRNA formyltransferase